jgi:hypothetical protein
MKIRLRRALVSLLVLTWAEAYFRFPIVSVDISFSFPYVKLASKKLSSGVDNWYLDEFLEEFICDR